MYSSSRIEERAFSASPGEEQYKENISRINRRKKTTKKT
jgi:hypothetical protein